MFTAVRKLRAQRQGMIQELVSFFSFSYIFPFRTIGDRIGIQITLVACNRGNKLCHGCGHSCESPWLEILREIPARFPPTIQIQDSPAHYHFHIAVIMEHRCSGCCTTITPISTNHTHIAIASALELDLIQIRLNWYNDTTRHLASFCGDSSHFLPIAAQVYLHLLAHFCHPSSQQHFYLSTLALAFPRPHVLCQTPGAHSHNCRSCALHSPCVHTNPTQIWGTRVDVAALAYLPANINWKEI